MIAWRYRQSCWRIRWISACHSLKDSKLFEGRLTGFDEYMNMVLDETMERMQKVGTEGISAE